MIATKNKAYQMVKEAVYAFKQLTGDFPVRVGLDWFTRMDEYSREYGEYYVDMAFDLNPVRSYATWPLDYTAYCRRIYVKIEPALFGQPEYYPDAPIIKNPPKEGKDEAYCERDGQFMNIVFSESGYDAILWDT